MNILEQLDKLRQNMPAATIARIGTRVERISGEAVYDSDLKSPVFIKNTRAFNLVGSDMTLNLFKSKLKAVSAFSKNKSISILYDDNEKYTIITPVPSGQDLITLDFMLNLLFCDNSPSIMENVKHAVLYIIKDNKIDPNLQIEDNYDEQEIRKLYWLNLRTVDLQLTGIISTSKAVTKVTSYALLFEKDLIYFRTDPIKGRIMFILRFPPNTILPLSDLMSLVK